MLCRCRQFGKFSACAGVFLSFIGTGWLLQILLCRTTPRTQTKAAIQLTQFWARCLVRIIGLNIVASDRRPSPWPERCLVVSNHQSYLDIIVLAAHFPVRFVAKKEVRNWPILGLMTQLSGAIFIDRSNARNSLRCGRAVTQSLQENLSVLIFPEGTSTNGTTVLPFKPMLFSAAAKANASVLPLTLHYEAVNGEKLQNRDLCCWHGDMNFFSHFWNALALRQITTSLEIHAMLAEPQHLTSQELAARAHETVSRALPGSTSNHAVPSVQSTEMDASSEFLWGAVILALLNYEQENLQQVEYGETQ